MTRQDIAGKWASGLVATHIVSIETMCDGSVAQAFNLPGGFDVVHLMWTSLEGLVDFSLRLFDLKGGSSDVLFGVIERGGCRLGTWKGDSLVEKNRRNSGGEGVLNTL